MKQKLEKRISQMIKITPVLLILLLFWPSLHWAQNTAEDLAVYDLQDTIVVVADRYKLPLKDLSYTYEVIPESKVRAMSKHSSLELVDIVFPSAFTIDSKIIGYGVGRDAAGSVNIRGQGGKPNTGMLVLLNGHPDFASLFGHPIPDVYGFDDVQQVEILAGPTSSVFGSQAMGGTINIKTGPNYKNFIRASAEAGSHNTYTLGLTMAKRLDKQGFFITARHDHTDGHIDQSSFESYRLQAGWQYQINDVWRLELQGRYIPFQFDEPVRAGDPANLGMYGKIKRGTGEIILVNAGSAWEGSSQIFGNWGNHRFYDGFTSDDFTFGLSSYQQLNLSEHWKIALGGELMSYGGTAENTLVPPGIVNNEAHEIRSGSAYALAMYNPVSDLSLKFGSRYQYSSLSLQNVSPVAGLTYRLLTGLHLYANYQSGFRYPTLNELYLFPTSNAELKEESIQSIEAGIMTYWSKRNTLRISVYNNQVKSMIQLLTNPAAPPPLLFVNSGEADQTGVELQLNYGLFPGLDAQLSYAYQDPGVLTAYNPKHQIKYLFSYLSGNFRAILHGKYIDQLFALNNGELRLPDYNLLNLVLSYDLSSWIINLRLFNLLDREYYVQAQYTAPGFYFLGGFEFRL
jgi:iron complex outermembrane receptor protein